jgi:hypothetical protein
MNRSLGESLLWQPWKLWIPKSSLTHSAFRWLLTRFHLMHGSTVMSFQKQVMVLNGSGQIGHRSEFLGFGVQDGWNLAKFDYRFCLTCSAFQRLLIHTISIITVMVTAIQRQHSCRVLADSWKSVSSMGLNIETVPEFGEYSNFFRLFVAYLIRWLYDLHTWPNRPHQNKRNNPLLWITGI